MKTGEIEKKIFDYLKEFPYKMGSDCLTQFFTSILNFNYTKEEIPKNILREEIKNRVKNINIISSKNDFNIFFIEVEKLNNAIEREVIEKLFSYGYPFGLFIFSDEKKPRTLHFVNVKYEEEKEVKKKILRRMVIGEGEGLRTYSERLAIVEIKDDTIPGLEIQRLFDEAFNVEKVTEEFFEKYKEILEEISIYLGKFGISEDNSRFFGIQLLNRMMFIYFIQKKGWLYWKIEDKEIDKPDKKYLYNFYLKYKNNWKTKESNFYRDYLSNLFFYAFNHNYVYKNTKLPDEVKISFSIMPYLNGGLFSKNKFDEIGEILIKDEIFDDIFNNLLERFNFTIREDLPFDIDVAVDPEMLGKVYESLVHGEEINERRKAGIFYTPRVEIDYMIKMSLVENLNRNLNIDKNKLIKFIFSDDKYYELTEKEKYEIKNYLDNIKILDPAVGSGSFLVRAMNILVELFIKLGYETNLFNLRKNIMKNSLYGVDVMEWAVRVAELRLWLNLLIDIDKDEIDIYTNPLLPNLSFNIRQGDSLVQEILGKSISLRNIDLPKIKNLTQEIAKEKRRFFDGESDRKDIIKKLEYDLIKTIYDEKKNKLIKDRNNLVNEKNKSWDQYNSKLSYVEENAFEKKKFEEEIENINNSIEKINLEIENLNKEFRDLLEKENKEFFLWDIDFSDVFVEKGGFDIIIGNPPYVRQELIGPPLEKNPTREQKDNYKKKLQEMVEKLWKIKVGGRCDLYVYFYFLSLSLLNKNGTFCFINSNSWLDVDFGKYLQEFLLKNFEMKRIIDNQVKRSFKEADINTVIVLINNTNKINLDNKVKFIMYKKPFEDVISIDNEIFIEEVNELKKNSNLRVFPKTQKELLLEGIEGDEPKEIKLISGKYEGGKWGGIYLRAPDIYFTILEKGLKCQKLAKLKNFCIFYGYV
ncbi:MAG: Eco57I restriction-modification methylase domain-containing protein, partial [Caldisericia bacterium]|nr:Eco57I restriction-modification methylase domain-containing protein [Caldisericia bacterium]